MNGFASHRFGSIFALAVLACLPLSAHAEPRVLRLLPSESLGFAYVRNPSEISTRVEKIGLELGVALPKLLDVARSVTGITKGYDAEKELVLGAAAAAEPAERPRPFAFVPVTDYMKFVSSFLPEGKSDASGIQQITLGGSQLLCAERQGYAVLVDAADRPLMDKLVNREPRIDANVAAIFDDMSDNDVTVVVLQPGVQFALDSAIESLEQVIGRLEAIGDDVPEQLEAGRGMLSLYLDCLRTIRSNTLLVAAGLSIDAQHNATLVKRFMLKPDGKLSKIFATESTADETSLAKLADQPFVLAAVFSLPREWANSLADFSLRMLEVNSRLYGFDELNDADRQEMREAYVATMEDVGSIAVTLRPGQPGDPLYGDFRAVMDVRDASAYLTKYEKALAVWNEQWQSAGGMLSMSYEVERLAKADLEGLKLSMGMHADPLDNAGAGINEMFEKMFGPGGKMVSYLLKVDGHTCLWVRAPESELPSIIQQYRKDPNRLPRDAQLAQTRRMLAPDAAANLYISPTGVMQFARRAAKELANTDLPIPGFPPAPPLGLSMAWDAEYLEFRVAVPGELFRAVGEFVKEMRSGAAHP